MLDKAKKDCFAFTISKIKDKKTGIVEECATCKALDKLYCSKDSHCSFYIEKKEYVEREAKAARKLAAVR